MQIVGSIGLRRNIPPVTHHPTGTAMEKAFSNGSTKVVKDRFCIARPFGLRRASDADVGRIHRLTIGEGPVQVNVTIEALRHFGRRLLAEFQRVEDFLPVYRRGLAPLPIHLNV